jgi:DNA modification methylase
VTHSRIERIGDAILYLGDCYTILPSLPPVDALVTDPPYGISWDRTAEKDSGRKPGKALAHKSHYEATGWDDSAAPDELIDLAISKARHAVIFGGNYYRLPPSSCWLVWDKETGTNEFADCELAWTNLKKPVKRIAYMWNGMLRANGEPRGEHPSQKPLGVMEWAIMQIPDEPQTILDPFMGSGTTGLAALNLGRKFVGIEREPKYFEAALRRISTRQERLFA